MIKLNFKSAITTASLALLLTSINVGSAYAIPATVKSDSAFNINSNLETELTKVSDGKSKLNAAIYSTNTISDTVAATINDSIVPTLPGTNYISIVLVKNPNGKGGTVSVNLGPDFKQYLTKEEISRDFVQPIRTQFLPSRPTEFVIALANSILTSIENKRSFNETSSFIGSILLYVLILIIAGFVLRLIVKSLTDHHKITKEDYDKAKEDISNCTDLYNRLLGDSSVLSGYEGRTKELADSITAHIVLLNDQFLKIKDVVAFKEAFFENALWLEYKIQLSSFKTNSEQLLTEVEMFVKRVSSVKEVTKDPMVLFYQEEEKRKRTY